MYLFSIVNWGSYGLFRKILSTNRGVSFLFLHGMSRADGERERRFGEEEADVC